MRLVPDMPYEVVGHICRVVGKQQGTCVRAHLLMLCSDCDRFMGLLLNSARTALTG
jgi:hypothetical protein